MPNLKQNSGFTLLEIMVVVVIIGIMATAITPLVMGRIHDARVAKAKQDIQQIESSLKMYKLDNFNYPSLEQGLDALVNQPAGDPPAKNWKQYLERLPNDPWGNPYQYLNPGTQGKIDIFSYGADGQEGGDEENKDIGNWGDDEPQA